MWYYSLLPYTIYILQDDVMHRDRIALQLEACKAHPNSVSKLFHISCQDLPKRNSMLPFHLKQNAYRLQNGWQVVYNEANLQDMACLLVAKACVSEQWIDNLFYAFQTVGQWGISVTANCILIGSCFQNLEPISTWVFLLLGINMKKCHQDSINIKCSNSYTQLLMLHRQMLLKTSTYKNWDICSVFPPQLKTRCFRKSCWYPQHVENNGQLTELRGGVGHAGMTFWGWKPVG